MLDRDYTEFSTLLDGVAGLLSRGSYTPSATNTALYFRALQAHDIDTIRAAFDAHVRDTSRGRFVPTPADVLAQIEAMTHDGRPGVEEAWAMIPTGEDQTVVWTAEMAEAFNAAAPLINAGDRIAARMTFKEVYERLLSQAKRTGKPVVWLASLGSDVEKRKRALTTAIEAGLLSPEAAHDACPALPMPESKRALLPAPNPRRRENYREKLNALVEATRGEPVDPLLWAKRLRDREKAGETLTPNLRTAWRNALDSKPSASAFMGSFAPIARDLLPPGMREARA